MFKSNLDEQSSAVATRESENVIEVNQLRKAYKKGLLDRKKFEALKGVSLNIKAGEVFGLLGPNGAGKTTLIKLLLGIIRPTSGHATVLNQPAGSTAARKRIGYLPENLNISRLLTGSEALRFYARLSRLSKSKVRQREKRVFERVGLLGREHERVGTYSKGMRQRVGLAQAMIHEPDILVMDEPTDGLDPVGRSEIRKIILDLKSQGKTIFLNSHILQEVELVCDRVAILANGEVRGVGTMGELTEQLTGGNSVKNRVVFAVSAGDMNDIINAVNQFHHLPSGQPWPDGWALDPLMNSATGANETGWKLTTSIASQPEIDQMVDLLRAAGASIMSLEHSNLNLEDVFFSLVSSST